VQEDFSLIYTQNVLTLQARPCRP